MNNSHATTEQFYIDGQWVEPEQIKILQVINPANETSIASIALGSPVDVDKAVIAARCAFHSFSKTTCETSNLYWGGTQNLTVPNFLPMW